MRPSHPQPLPPRRRHSLRVELLLDFDSPVGQRRAEEASRRLLEKLQVTALPDGAGGVVRAELRCHELRQTIRLLAPEAD
jgi:hypothetical protein